MSEIRGSGRREGTYTESSVFRKPCKVGRELFNVMSEFSKSVGIVTLFKAFKLGMVNCGTFRFTFTILVTLLIAATASAMTLFAEATSFWIEVRMELREFVMKSDI